MGATPPPPPQDLQDRRRSLLQRQGLYAGAGLLPVPEAEREAATHAGCSRHDRHRAGSRGHVPEEVSDHRDHLKCRIRVYDSAFIVISRSTGSTGSST